MQTVQRPAHGSRGAQLGKMQEMCVGIPRCGWNDNGQLWKLCVYVCFESGKVLKKSFEMWYQSSTTGSLGE